jgi:hypothetical protein
MEEENKSTKQKQFAHKRIITKTWKEKKKKLQNKNQCTQLLAHNQ